MEVRPSIRCSLSSPALVLMAGQDVAVVYSPTFSSDVELLPTCDVSQREAQRGRGGSGERGRGARRRVHPCIHTAALSLSVCSPVSFNPVFPHSRAQLVEPVLDMYAWLSNTAGVQLAARSSYWFACRRFFFSFLGKAPGTGEDPRDAHFFPNWEGARFPRLRPHPVEYLLIDRIAPCLPPAHVLCRPPGSPLTPMSRILR